MSLTAQFAGDFDRGIRDRGGNYFRSGCVRIGSASAFRIVATVSGSSRYRVELNRDGRKIHASCTCPYFDVDLCKHIWAVILAAETQELFQGKGLELVHAGEADDDYPDDEFDAGDYREDNEGEREDEEHGRAPPYPLVPARAASRARSPAPGRPIRPNPLDWRKQMAGLGSKPRDPYSLPPEPWPPARELLYVIDVARARADGSLYLDVLCRDRKKDGGWSKPKARNLRREWLQQVPDPDDRHILAFLAGATPAYGGYQLSSVYAPPLPYRYGLIDPQPRLLLPMLCRTGRCHLRLTAPGEEEPEGPPLTWQDGEPWHFRLEVRRAREGDRYEAAGTLRRGEERMELSTPLVLQEAGILLTREWAAHYEHRGAFSWMRLLREQGPLQIPAAQSEEFLAELLGQPRLPPLDLPEELRYEEVMLAPRPRLAVKPAKNGSRDDQLHGELSFDYDGVIVAHGRPERGTIRAAERRMLLRDFTAESAALERLQALGWRWEIPRHRQHDPRLELSARHLPAVVLELTTAGWHVEAEGKLYRSPGKFELQVSSGVDWFELHGAIEFGDSTAQLPELLAAMRRGEHTVQLGDCSFGLLPQEWLKRYGLLAGLGEPRADHLRFARSQVGLLDALLAAQPETRCDALFGQVRDGLRSFAGIRAIEAPVGFEGELRPYQQEALGWFDFLRRFGFGGCLADDMGLGKTVQVLALLEARREQRLIEGTSARVGPSLAVVPKSLIFNWKQEAARFAPRLRVLDHTGSLRARGIEQFDDYDLVLTTYGTLRNDAAEFRDLRFDYLILDEAQAIKNPDSVSAKSARLLQADHRLALSGTPIENHLGELWSLFEFLNPGMLGAASVFKMAHGAARNPDEDTRTLLARALRPFILRRTKEQVVRELPPKVEQTLYCELDPPQRKLYDQLRDHYRATLLKRVQTDGIGRAKILVLEALLRLRQAAIHPGLLDPGHLAKPSAKLDMLLPRVLEVIEEGHKTLVFSQFTGMLSILRQHLDRAEVRYEYLDGKTRDRQACVERFQNSADCKLFLISLKAGGLGLNLTAAQYVFLLDPWWNPAVEAQAIDRAHRIGQTRQVFAYRLIARGTVEEKVLELQNTKRDLADAIVGANEGVIRSLKKEDLELLLS
ncbi:MAG TPA: DEAD/DEAH box helicase [Steroidobacteraceae bacterium]|nr:DEAD/DEAH box helicase [Steroidobacteraceae bacterium]